MRNAWSLFVVGFAAAALLVATGCGSEDGTTDAAAQPASINGSNVPTGGTEKPTATGLETPTTGPRIAGIARDPLHPKVLMETSLGNITITLDAEKAGLTVDNFLNYVESGHYDQTIFHQVFQGYVALGGMYTPESVEKETAAPIRNEARNGLKNLRGTIAMARLPDSIDSATSQFFFNVKDNPNLDHKDQAAADYSTPEDYGYCVFGKVTEGMEVVDRIASVPVHDTGDFERIPVETVLIRSIRRIP